MTLRDDEKLIKVIRRHKSSLNRAWFLSAAAVFAFFFSKSYLKFNFFGYSWQVFSVLAFVLAVFILYKLYVWRNDALFVTSQRVLRNEQEGIFQRSVTEILYQDIHEIMFNKKGFGSVVNNYGNLVIRTPSGSEIVFEKIPNPEKVVETINKARLLYGPSEF